MDRRRRNAFTLVEVLLVVVIMAILAATVIPQFSTSSEDAKESTLAFNIHTLRSQIELYKLHHKGNAPAITAGDLPQLTTGTNVDGATGTPGDEYPYGPYLVNGVPPNPITGISTVTAQATWPPSAETETGGWLYHEATGQIAPDSEDFLDY
jgi:prepilin-type N-terminal cleavage/methylation domain-containing protein